MSAIFLQKAAWARLRFSKKKRKSMNTCTAPPLAAVTIQSRTHTSTKRTGCAKKGALVWLPFASKTSYIDSGGVGEGVGLGVVSVAGAVSAAGVGVGVGVAVGGGFTGDDGDELAGGVERTGVVDGATSSPAPCRPAARNFSADCGGCTEPVKMVLKSIWRP